MYLHRAPGLAAATGYECGPKVCASNVAEMKAVFVSLQQMINRFGGSAGFAPIATDGIIGSGTTGAYNKVVGWIIAQKRSISISKYTKEELARNAGTAIGTLQAVAIALSPSAAKNVVVTSPATGQQVTVPPVSDLYRPAATPMWPYYVAAGLGGFAILAIAFKLSNKHTTARLPATSA